LEKGYQSEIGNFRIGIAAFNSDMPLLINFQLNNWQGICFQNQRRKHIDCYGNFTEIPLPMMKVGNAIMKEFRVASVSGWGSPNDLSQVWQGTTNGSAFSMPIVTHMTLLGIGIL